MARTGRADPSAMAPDPPDPGGLVVRLLGGFAAAVGGRQVARAAWRLHKALSLVKLLALAPGHRLPRDQLLDLLWPDLDPAAAANNLHRTLHAARHALAPAGDHGVLPLRGGVLALDHPGGVRVDVDDFAAAASLARRTRDLADYRAALALYAGELLPEDRYEDWAAPRREALRQEHLALLGEAAERHAAAGEHRAAAELLAAAVAQDPASEELGARLMRAHAAAGRRAAALREYERLRDALRRELDAAPEPATRALHEAIRTRRFPPARAPRAPEAPAIAAAARHNLPRPVSSFVGRTAELARLTAWLTDPDGPRLISLIGSGGAGKTRLALEVSRAVVETFPGGVWFVELGSVATLHLVIAAIAAVLAIQLPAHLESLDALVAGLRDLRCLLVLDNCEQVAEACRDVLIAALARSPVRVLLTSRVPLGVIGEQHFRVPSLAVPEEDPGDDWMAVERTEAGQLFAERARLVAPDFAIRADDARTVADICRRLDGMPLAIELAAVQLGNLSVAQLDEQLARSFAILRGEGTGLPTRQQTLEATIAWSYRLLDESGRALLRRLSAFAGGFTLDAAGAVCGDLGPPDEIFRLLRQLVEHSLVAAEDRGGATARYRLNDAIRQYAHEQLLAHEGESGVRRRHCDWCLALAERVPAPLEGGTAGRRWLAHLDPEMANIRAALAWAREHDPSAGLRLAGAAWPHWFIRQGHGEGREWLGDFLARESAPTRWRARALLGLGYLGLWRDLREARARLAEAFAIADDIEDHDLLLAIRFPLGYACLATGDLAAAEAHWRAGWAVAQELRRPGARSHYRLLRGYLDLQQGRLDDAHAALAEALRDATAADQPVQRCMILARLGEIELKHGEFARAREHYRQLLAIADDLRSLFYRFVASFRLGMTEEWLGQLNDASVAYETSYQLAALDERNRAERAICLTGLGRVALYQRDYDRAADLLHEAVQLAEELDDRLILRGAEAALGVALWCADQRASGLRHLLAGLAMRLEQRDWAGLAFAFEWAAEIALADGKHDFAARWLGVADNLRTGHQIPRAPVDAAAHAAAIAALTRSAPSPSSTTAPVPLDIEAEVAALRAYLTAASAMMEDAAPEQNPQGDGVD